MKSKPNVNRDRKISILVMLEDCSDRDGKNFFREKNLRAFPVGDLIRRWTVEIQSSKLKEVSKTLEQEELVKQIII